MKVMGVKVKMVLHNATTTATILALNPFIYCYQCWHVWVKLSFKHTANPPFCPFLGIYISLFVCEHV